MLHVCNTIYLYRLSVLVCLAYLLISVELIAELGLMTHIDITFRPASYLYSLTLRGVVRR
jgi:hypothetical protein